MINYVNKKIKIWDFFLKRFVKILRMIVGKIKYFDKKVLRNSKKMDKGKEFF